jgi:O-antigen ligase
MALPAPSKDNAERAPAGGAAALCCGTLVLLAALLPWFFGGVLRETRQAALLVGLFAALAAYLWSLYRRALELPALPLWPPAVLLALGALQLVPLPPALHALVAPGSHAIWHPRNPAAGPVLGAVWRPLSVDPSATSETLAFAGLLGLLALLAAPALGSRRAALRAGLVVALSGTAVGVFGVATRTAFGPLLYGHIAVPTINPYGPFVNKNHFAGYVAMAALLAAGICLGLKEETRRRARDGDWRHGAEAGWVLALGAASLSGALAVLVSLSRGGSLGLVAGALVFVVVHVLATRARRGAVYDRRLTALFGAGGLLLLVAALVVLPAESKARLGRLSLRDASLSFRLSTWAGTLRLATHSPALGYGYGAFEPAYRPYKTSLGDLQVEHPENQMLELLAEGGLAGLFGAFVTLRVLAGAATAGARRRGEPLLRGLVTGATAGLCALLVQDLVDFNLHVPSNACLFTLLVAVVAAGHGVRTVWGWRACAGVGMALAVVALAATSFASAPPSLETWRESAQRAAGLSSERALRLERTEAGLRAYLQHRPSDPEAWLLLGWTRLLVQDRVAAKGLFEHARALDPANPLVEAQVRSLTP